MEYPFCLDSAPNLLGIFDTTIAPSLLYYSYIPIIVVSFLFGLLVFNRNVRGFIRNRILFSILVVFSMFILNEIVQWIAVPTSLVHFGWESAPLLQTIIVLLSVYFVLVFVNQKDIIFEQKVSLSLFIVPVLIFLPTNFNMESFDLMNCQSNIGPLFTYVYILQILAIVFILLFCLRKCFKIEDRVVRKQALYVIIGTLFFLSLLSSSNILGELTKEYEFNLIGPIGMLVFLTFLVYMTVRFKTFNIKLLATQALVWGMTFLIGAQFFFIQNKVNYFLNGFTFVASLFFGQLLIQSVKNEVSQREILERINKELQGLIQQRESLVHLITHKVKGSFTRSKFLFSEMLAGSFGEITPELKKMTERGLESDVEGIATVDLVLNASNLQKGTVKYDLKPTDFKKILDDVLLEKKIAAENRGLHMNTEIAEGEYIVNGDAFWLKEVVLNLVQNAIVYTPKGDVNITLKKITGVSGAPGKLLFYVKDTGIGITPEDMKNLFTEGGRGKESIKVNVDSTGYGLYTVKLIIEAHNGRIWVESEGSGKGSTFFVELVLIQ